MNSLFFFNAFEFFRIFLNFENNVFEKKFKAVTVKFVLQYPRKMFECDMESYSCRYQWRIFGLNKLISTLWFKRFYFTQKTPRTFSTNHTKEKFKNKKLHMDSEKWINSFEIFL